MYLNNTSSGNDIYVAFDTEYFGDLFYFVGDCSMGYSPGRVVILNGVCGVRVLFVCLFVYACFIYLFVLFFCFLFFT
jgi:hypothetical protein